MIEEANNEFNVNKERKKGGAEIKFGFSDYDLLIF